MEVVYPAKKGNALFNFKFPEATELSGYIDVEVLVEARPGKAGEVPPDDMGMFVAVNKLDRDGNSGAAGAKLRDVSLALPDQPSGIRFKKGLRNRS